MSPVAASRSATNTGALCCCTRTQWWRPEIEVSTSSRRGPGLGGNRPATESTVEGMDVLHAQIVGYEPTWG
ncbi:hypothetical protein BA895_22070 [Humibacillus sp. DSM 29435]|nr:hypothetical protein BA895_22070 [Humibacillus sp. DSM 29435]